MLVDFRDFNELLDVGSAELLENFVFLLPAIKLNHAEVSEHSIVLGRAVQRNQEVVDTGLVEHSLYGVLGLGNLGQVFNSSILFLHLLGVLLSLLLSGGLVETSLSFLCPLFLSLGAFIESDLEEYFGLALLFSVWGKSVTPAFIDLDVTEAQQHRTKRVSNLRVKVDAGFLEAAVKFMHVHDFLERLLTVGVFEDGSNLRLFFSEDGSDFRAFLSVAAHELLNGFLEGYQVEVGWAFHFFLGNTELLGQGVEVLLLGVFLALAFLLVFSFGRLFGPSGPVTVTSHVVLGESKQLEGLE